MGKSKSPGPVYLLPSCVGYEKHDISRYRNPQYSMSPRLPAPGSKSQAPGPQYEVRGMTEHGKLQPPAYSIKSRPKDKDRNIGPGPGAYFIKTGTGPKPPAYTMQGRAKFLPQGIGPGPAYNLPSMLGPKVPNKPAAGAYTMAARTDGGKLKQSSPGPAVYSGIKTDIYKTAQPKYTMSARWKGFSGRHGSPGPAAYLPKKICGEKGPMFSMRSRYGENFTPYVTADDNMPCADH